MSSVIDRIRSLNDTIKKTKRYSMFYDEFNKGKSWKSLDKDTKSRYILNYTRSNKNEFPLEYTQINMYSFKNIHFDPETQIITSCDINLKL